jgi:hypothetical protein
MRTRQSGLDLTVVQRGFNTVTVTVGGLYLATRSVIVTIIGTAAASLLTCWALWLVQRRGRTDEGRESQSSAIDQTEPRPTCWGISGAHQREICPEALEPPRKGRCPSRRRA